MTMNRPIQTASALTLFSILVPLGAQVTSGPDLSGDPSRIPYEDHVIVRMLPGYSAEPIAKATGRAAGSSQRVTV